MAFLSAYHTNLLTSVANVGPLEAAHLKLLLDQIEADTAETVTYLLTSVFTQLRANGFIGATDAAYIQAAIVARAATHDAAIDNAAETTAALRKLGSIWPASTVEDLVTLLCV